MTARANWKGFLKIGELSCPVALFTAASQSERIAFHTLNRKTGNRVHRQFVDGETGKPVEREDQVKGYEVSQGEYVVFEPDEIAAVVPESDKTLKVERFIACGDIDDVYFDRPYYLAPSDPVAVQAFNLIRDGMKQKKVAALARTVLFRRVRTLLIRAHDKGLIATTLNFDYEVRSSDEAFEDVPKRKIQGEMLDLAKHIIETKQGEFDPSKFDDRYESALAELVKAKLAGKPLPKPKAPKPTKVVDLMEALRQSAGARAEKTPPAKGTAKKAASKKAAATPHRKAG
ncbi:MAG: Ku78, Ku70 and Ku80 are 70kDa and 80kDa subunit of the Lupus Ku autoantigen [Rhodospirillales bacterium]|nr:Ku78, Ku70 and Ku80 are 70kDa and 80kDa subunit of the Lupus Ku autoantigen [Rhodospirillales bacterium]